MLQEMIYFIKYSIYFSIYLSANFQIFESNVITTETAFINHATIWERNVCNVYNFKVYYRICTQFTNHDTALQETDLF